MKGSVKLALIKCSECGKEVSDKAESCPNCGNPINKESKIMVYGYSESYMMNLLMELK